MKIRALFGRALLASACALGMFGAVAPAQAAGDLLVAPTRVVLDGPRGAEIVLNNIGTEIATYRISLEIKRMTADGALEDVAIDATSGTEKAAVDMISYSPKKVVLPPNQPQTIRIGTRLPQGLPDGEYRVHMLFRAIPAATAPAALDAPPASGVSIALTPIYGVTIPVIVRQGKLEAQAALSNPRLEADDENPDAPMALKMDISRTGNRSVYGEIRVFKPGVAEPLIAVRGIAVYTEVGARTLSLPLPKEAVAALKGPVTIQYVEDRDAGGATLAEVKGVLQ
jgi:P pilus assembly chaperone PapD